MEDFSITEDNVQSPFLGKINTGRINYNGRDSFCGGRKEIFFQIHLGSAFKTVTAVATQGRYQTASYVRTYRLAFSRMGDEWFYYKENGETKVHKIARWMPE